MHISDEDVAAFKRQGYLIVPQLLTSDEVATARENFASYFPSWEDWSREPAAHPRLGAGQGWQEAPFAGQALNAISLHPDLVSFMERAIGTSDIYLTQSLIWGKYAGRASFEQPLHRDFNDNSLLPPRNDDGYRQVVAIIYYTDVTAELGPTHVLSTERSEDLELVPHARARELDPDLYRHEVAGVVPAGGAVLFHMRTFHRGSAFRGAAGARFSHHLAYRPRGMEWMGWRAWGHFWYSEEMRDWVVRCSPRQRQLLGFPAPGDPYWTDATVAGLAEMYAGIDVEPYRSQLPADPVAG